MRKALFEKLSQVRENRASWQEFINLPSDGDEYFDLNYQNRGKILIALQFYKEESDEEFIKFLFEEEIKDRKKDPFQGNTEALNRGGYLLSTYRKPGNIWLFLDAKRSNFDTYCGFDWEHILSAGVRQTFDYIERSEREEKEHFYEYFPNRKDCELSELDIEKWLENKLEHFPKKRNDDDLEFWITMALDLSEKEEAIRLINKFEDSNIENEEILRSLKYYKGRVDDNEGQIAIIKKLIDKPFYEHNIMGDYLDLSRLYLKIEQIKESWNTIKIALRKCKISNRYSLGLFSEQAMNIVLKSKPGIELNIVDKAYKFAIENSGNILPLAKLEKYYNCAKKMNDKENEERYYQEYIEEKRRIDDMLK